MSGMGTSFAAAEIMEEMRLMFNEGIIYIDTLIYIFSYQY